MSGGTAAAPANPMHYQPRRVLDLGTVTGLWTAKIYAILSESWLAADLPRQDQITLAITRAMPELAANQDHDPGFAILHMANDGVYLLLTRFNNANNLRHVVFEVLLEPDRLDLVPLSDRRIIACVWELRLMKFEADAWIDTILTRGLCPQSQSDYLTRRFCGNV